MSSSTSLNLANHTTVWDDNFAANPTVDGNIFPVKWGDASEYSASNGDLTMTDDGNAAGVMQQNNAPARATVTGCTRLRSKATTPAPAPTSACGLAPIAGQGRKSTSMRRMAGMRTSPSR
jgi:hypothetical protein